ncbi:Uncharacterised protein [Burkholderia pseudomallei]|nr:Uncharacterised protein [Burkholderia pseudomallei]CAJ3650634.1 Uncharacterised protein [Burkholderia pseudomallei]CAJ5404661.1 Uncharacterised protein [Burkholderia pseudomallei]CAJ5518953.1 Uncharacterised protein [Burkholderia pseudomallei]CAJ5590032.1 Uncharacterised protein [Burkholderia pseudomallei]
MLVQPFEVNFNVIQRAQFLNQLVGEREQFRLKGTDHLAICLLKLRCVDQLPFLFRQRQQFDLAIDTFGHRALGHKVNTGLARATGGHLSQVPKVSDADLIHRRRSIVDVEPVNKTRNGRLIEVEMLGDLLLGWHEYAPPRSFTSREKARVRTPACTRAIGSPADFLGSGGPDREHRDRAIARVVHRPHDAVHRIVEYEAARGNAPRASILIPRGPDFAPPVMSRLASHFQRPNAKGPERFRTQGL